MTPASPSTRALLVTPSPELRLRKLSAFLGEEGVELVQVASAEEAAALFLTSEREVDQFVLVDGDQRPAQGGGTALEHALQELANLHQHLPALPCILVATGPTAPAITAALRAGAHDVLDLATERAGGVRDLIKRATREYRSRRNRLRDTAELRDLLEEFLRVLVKTERRSIDLEQLLASEDPGTAAIGPDIDPERRPVVMVIDDDESVTDALSQLLEEAAMVACCFASGEAAVAALTAMKERGEPVDLALVDTILPGIDGVETIRQLRALCPQLPAMMMTGYGNGDSAMKAADLGVIGYVLKPFDNVGGFIERIRENAAHARDMSRERHYLLEIKKRHEHVLARYRKLVGKLAERDEPGP